MRLEAAGESPVGVAAFTAGRNVPSARFRIRQYIPALRRLKVDIREFRPRVGGYPPARRHLRPVWAGALMMEQSLNVALSWRYDVCLLQREFMSTYCTLEPLTRGPRVLDVDDAIFIHRGGRAARRLAQLSEVVVCGNEFLAEWFGECAKRVVVIPTGVDAERFVPRSRTKDPSDPLVVGWVGSSSHLDELNAIEPALRNVLSARPNAVLRVVSDRAPSFCSIGGEQVQFVKWSESREVENTADMDIGIMPLRDNAMARGKCSFKMLQYMSCGLPVVVSPVGMNSQVLGLGHVGLGATTASEWTEGLVSLIDDEKARARLGGAAREVIHGHFATEMLAARIAQVIRGVI